MKKLYTFFDTKFGKTILFSLLFLFLFCLELNIVGLSIREKITLGSTLDFSWFSDAIERKLHGYILGRDFTFTYGPLFQYIYSLPSAIFHVPSYVSVALSPLLSFVIVFGLLVYIAQNLSKNIFNRITYILFYFIILGLLITSGFDTIKLLIPIVYSIAFYRTLNKNFHWTRIIVISLLPTVFGLYAYNLFFTTCLIAILLSFFYSVKKKKTVFKYKFLFILPLIAVFQLAISFLLTHNFDYIYYSFDSISNYRYVLDVPWAHDRDNILLIFPLALAFLSIFLFKTNKVTSEKRNVFLILIFASFVELDYAISRSDAGHLLWAFYPSIITFFSIVFILATRLKILFPLAFILYILVPFKPTFYNTLAPKNILTVFQVIHQKPDFFSLYKLPANYYFSEKEITSLMKFVKQHKKEVYIYPYDSYILNSEGTTYNSYALGIYTYSNSPVERNTVTQFSKTPPQYIVLEIDTKGALNLDDIPNFTRNPQLAQWMIENYSIKEKTKKYFILAYTQKKKITSKSCQIIRLTINLSSKESTIQHIEDMIKPAVYYVGATRLPYTPFAGNYVLFRNSYDEAGITNLFQNNDEKYLKLPQQYLKGLTVIRVDPFTSKKQSKYFFNTEYKSECVGLK